MGAMKSQPLRETLHGFRWGPLLIERVASDKAGYVWLQLTGKNGRQRQLSVTPSGRMRLESVSKAPRGAFKACEKQTPILRLANMAACDVCGKAGHVPGKLEKADKQTVQRVGRQWMCWDCWMPF